MAGYHKADSRPAAGVPLTVLRALAYKYSTMFGLALPTAPRPGVCACTCPPAAVRGAVAVV